MSMLFRIGGALLVALIALPVGAVEIKEVTSPGGITFWMVEEPSIPIVSVEISFDGGARLDPEGKEGLSGMTMALIEEGTGDLDAVAFANARDDLSARFGFGAGRDGVSVSAQMLVETMEPSSELLATAIESPAFAPQAIDRVRAQILSGLAEAETSPRSIARKDWFARAYPDHPYGRTSTPESIQSLTREDLEAAMPRLINRANATVALVGAVNSDEAGKLVDTLFRGVPEGEKLEKPWIAMTDVPGVKVIDLDVPQSTAIFGHAGIKRSDPDFIAAFVMNYILGGGSFNSRLTDEVREKRGLAYSVYSYISDLDESALYLGSVQTANAGMAESLELIRGEWERMATDGLSQEDLDRAKKYLTGAFPLRFDSNAKIAGYLVFIQKEGLGIDYLDKRNDLVNAVTLEEANRVAARVLKSDALMFTVVGRPEGVQNNP
ncbi:MAG: pitrilysin family protein [Pseudomonadota bacterium]